MLQFRRISTTLQTTHLLMALVPLFMLGVLSYQIAASIIKSQSFNQLHAVNENKQVAIARYFDGISDQIVTLAANPIVAEAFTALQQGFESVGTENALESAALSRQETALANFYKDSFSAELSRQNPDDKIDTKSLLNSLSANGRQLQYQYVATNPNPLGEKFKLDRASDNSDYSNEHERYHPVFRQIQQRFGLYDIFLIDAASGKIVYTVFKEIDFANNLQSGALQNSSLGEVYQRALKAEPGTVVLADFAPYLPSYDAPASFIGAPIYVNGKLLGVLAFQIPIDRINQVMGLRAGMGETGESYLVGPDQLMRSDSYLDPSHHSVMTSFQNPSLGTIDTEASRQALNGTTGEGIIIDYNGNPVLSAYAPLELYGLKWAILSEIDEAEAFAGVQHLRNLTFLLGLLVAVLGAFAANRISKTLARPILQICDGIKQVAAGSLTVEMSLARKDELGQLGEVMEAMQEKLKRVIRQEIVPLVQSASEGNLEVDVAEHDKAGFYLELAQTLNGLMQINRDFLTDTASAINSMRRGELEFVLNTKFRGRFADVQQDIDVMRSTLRAIVCKEVQQVVRAAAKGNLSIRVNEQGKTGCYLGLAQAVNQLVEINDTIIGDTVLITSSLAKGDLDTHCERSYEGSFATLIDNVRQLQAGLKHVIHNEIRKIVDAATQGDLSGRLDLNSQQGFYRSLAGAINLLIGTCDQVLTDTSTVMSAIADGDLCKRISNEHQGSFQILRDSVNQSADAVTGIVSKIRQTVNAVESGMQEIASGNMDLSARTESQAASLEETSSAIEQMSGAVQSTAANATAATESSLRAAQLAEQGGKVVGDAMNAMDKINEASAKIAAITEVINGISFQTNLLALNAAVEAARAGDHGHGFAVVANEVRILAGRSSKAAKEIEALIKDSEARVHEGASLVNRSGGVLSEIIKASRGVSELLEGMRTATDEQSIGLNEISKSVAQIDQNTQQNSALVEETAAASTALVDQAKELTTLTSYFKILDSTDFRTIIRSVA